MFPEVQSFKFFLTLKGFTRRYQRFFNPKATFYRLRLFRDNLYCLSLIKSDVNILYVTGLTLYLPQQLQQNTGGSFLFKNSFIFFFFISVNYDGFVYTC